MQNDEVDPMARTIKGKIKLVFLPDFAFNSSVISRPKYRFWKDRVKRRQTLPGSSLPVNLIWSTKPTYNLTVDNVSFWFGFTINEPFFSWCASIIETMKPHIYLIKSLA